ncbi:amino acid aminotransferase [Candidatus Erwinia haradaeae]|uniref:Aminotransferase n=1 Tax=Candidatus Erwinia haradaeae TaxID=1922217 RepID=A0A451DGE3_9GAMM|nr:amino acid aminotransferase [Candidatus Erwinia haradaeae]VFP85711.1 Aspartate aminotransferase [Candidatus Erwinia haradaeae]
MFELIKESPPDPILGLNTEFHADQNIEKINLGIGVYTDHTGNTSILSSVKKAEKFLLEREVTKNYLQIDGLPDFGYYTQELLFGQNNPLIKQKRIRTAQTPGGTGALRIIADFIANQTNAKNIWISNPGWQNYKNIFSAAGLKIYMYNYYDPINHTLDFSAMKHSLNSVRPGDVVVFQGCCHNPTGVDPSHAQWKYLSKMSLEKGWIPLFDYAYQGFSKGLAQDSIGLSIFSTMNKELIVCSSYSKNFSLYNERVGSLSIVASQSTIVDTAFSQIKSTIRSNYSSPPSHGAAVVLTILSNQALRLQWENELSIMRERITLMRQLLVDTLKTKIKTTNFSFITSQTGMFSLIGLSPKQIERLRNEFGVYILQSGRMNIAGITLKNLFPLCAAINHVL